MKAQGLHIISTIFVSQPLSVIKSVFVRCHLALGCDAVVEEYNEGINTLSSIASSNGSLRGPVKIEVKNVPRGVSIEAVKYYFEIPEKSGGFKGAVADIRKITERVFHVTFSDHSG